MSPLSVFSSPFLLGFDELEQLFERIAKAPNNGYPPYNIERFGTRPCSIRIVLAVAGFSIDDLDGLSCTVVSANTASHAFLFRDLWFVC